MADVKHAISVDEAILFVLSGGAAYGRVIRRFVLDRTGGELDIGPGTLYPALHRLERQGFLESHWGEQVPKRGGRPRRYYELTETGIEAAMDQSDQVKHFYGLTEVTL